MRRSPWASPRSSRGRSTRCDVVEDSLDPGPRPRRALHGLRAASLPGACTAASPSAAADPGLHRPHGFGQHCGLFFWLLGPSGDFKTKVLPGGAFPRRDGTTGWELRTMRFTTPPREAFTDRSPDADDRLHLRLQVQLFGTGTIQVDD